MEIVNEELTGLWAIGTPLGIDMLFVGISMISIGSAARKVATRLVMSAPKAMTLNCGPDTVRTIDGSQLGRLRSR